MPGAEQIRAFILAEARKAAAAKGLGTLEITDDLHLVDAGLLDSISFLGLIAALEEQFGAAVDLADADPAEFFTVGGLTRCATAALPVPAGG